MMCNFHIFSRLLRVCLFSHTFISRFENSSHIFPRFSPFLPLEMECLVGGYDDPETAGDVGSLQSILEDYIEVDRYQVEREGHRRSN